MLPLRHSCQLQGHTQVQSKEREIDIPCKQKPKEEAGVAILLSEKKWTLNKNFNKRQRRSLYNNKGVNSSRGYSTVVSMHPTSEYINI